MSNLSGIRADKTAGAVRAAGDLPAPAALETLAASHRRQLALCTELEDVADSLPDRVDQLRCLHLARAIGAIVIEAHELEERLLFARISGLASRHIGLAGSIERLRWEHFEDMCFGEEICEALLDIGRGTPALDKEALGYMLRGFFEGLRRHIAFEREILIPLLSEQTGDA